MATRPPQSRARFAAPVPRVPVDTGSPWTLERGRLDASRERKRESVLLAAATAFAQRGVDGTSMDDLAASLGVTKPTIYRTVGGKDALVRACEARMNQRFRDALAEARTVRGSGLQKIAHYLRCSLDLMVGDTFGRLILPMTNPDMYATSPSATREMREEAETQFRTWLGADIRAGIVRADVDPKLATLALFATFNFIPRWYRPDGPMSLDQLFDANFRIFVTGIAADTAPARRTAAPTGRARAA
jgi:AcrR family transcriptional regulator